MFTENPQAERTLPLLIFSGKKALEVCSRTASLLRADGYWPMLFSENHQHCRHGYCAASTFGGQLPLCYGMASYYHMDILLFIARNGTDGTQQADIGVLCGGAGIPDGWQCEAIVDSSTNFYAQIMGLLVES